MVELHLPVMEREVKEYLLQSSDGIYLDATVGDGGHAEAVCRSLTGRGKLIGLDWDRDALQRAEIRLAPFKEKIILIHDSYTFLLEVLKNLEVPQVDGILIDLGASTLQLMDPERGFSFHREGDLDMRMDRRRSLTAKEIVNNYSKEDMTEIFFTLGEERWSRRIAANIVRRREKDGEINDSRHLAEIVKEAVPARFRRRGGHPARLIFQALRLAVNGELDNIKKFLPQAVEALLPGARLCVLAYHSLEDRLVKKYFQQEAAGCNCPPNLPCICNQKPRLRVVTGKVVTPSVDEIDANPRARSAKLRVAEKINGS